MNFKTFFQNINPLHKPSADVLARLELEDAKRALLEAQSGMEYAKAMVMYRTEQIERLSKVVKNV